LESTAAAARARATVRCSDAVTATELACSATVTTYPLPGSAAITDTALAADSVTTARSASITQTAAIACSAAGHILPSLVGSPTELFP
jgi:hypothetical protein